MNDINENTKIVFLDVDGVLNSESIFDELVKMKTPLPTMVHLDWRNVVLLNHFMSHDDVRFVISSSWRIFYSLENIKTFLHLTGLTRTHFIIDETPRVNHYRDEMMELVAGQKKNRHPKLNPTEIRRGLEIHEWMSNNNIVPKKDNYLIIDDSSDFLNHHGDNFLHTNPNYGLTEEDVDKGLKILNLKRLKNVPKPNSM